MTKIKYEIQQFLWGAIALLCLPFLSPAQAGEPAPEFSLPTDQGEISMDGLHGQVVYLDFWASWCVPCRKSFPWMNEMVARYQTLGFKVVAVNMDTDRGLVDRFLERYPAKFTIAFNPEGDVAESYRVQGMPSSFLIDRQGMIRATHIGFRDSEKAGLEAEIRALLK